MNTAVHYYTINLDIVSYLVSILSTYVLKETALLHAVLINEVVTLIGRGIPVKSYIY